MLSTCRTPSRPQTRDGRVAENAFGREKDWLFGAARLILPAWQLLPAMIGLYNATAFAV